MFTYAHVCTERMCMCVCVSLCVHADVCGVLTNKPLWRKKKEKEGYFVHLCIELVLIYLLFTPLGC